MRIELREEKDGKQRTLGTGRLFSATLQADMMKRISDLDAEIALIRSEEPSRVEMQDEIIRLQADISRLRDIIASLERALDVKHERIKELEGHAAGEDAYHHGYRDGYKAGLEGR